MEQLGKRFANCEAARAEAFGLASATRGELKAVLKENEQLKRMMSVQATAQAELEIDSEALRQKFDELTEEMVTMSAAHKTELENARSKLIQESNKNAEALKDNQKLLDEACRLRQQHAEELENLQTTLDHIDSALSAASKASQLSVTRLPAGLRQAAIVCWLNERLGLRTTRVPCNAFSAKQSSPMDYCAMLRVLVRALKPMAGGEEAIAVRRAPYACLYSAHWTGVDFKELGGKAQQTEAILDYAVRKLGVDLGSSVSPGTVAELLIDVSECCAALTHRPEWNVE